MTLSQPAELPTWAAQDQIDPVSGQNNVLTPPVQQQQYGWQRLAFPPRNWFNWLGRLTYQWLQYFRQNDTFSTTVITSAVQGGNSVLPICNPSIATRGVTMIYINDIATGNNGSRYVGFYVRNATSSVTPNVIQNTDPVGPYTITTGTVDKDTGILNNISSTAGSPGPFNIIAVSYNITV